MLREYTEISGKVTPRLLNGNPTFLSLIIIFRESKYQTVCFNLNTLSLESALEKSTNLKESQRTIKESKTILN